MMEMKDFLNEKDVRTIKNRLKLLILNSYAYSDFINEKFIEHSDFKKGKKGLSSKVSLRFNTSMRNSAIDALIDFENNHTNNITEIYSKYVPTDWSKLSDELFIVNLERFITRLSDEFLTSIYKYNIIKTKYQYSEMINVNKFGEFIYDFELFRDTLIKILDEDINEPYKEILGKPLERLIKLNNKLPKVTINVELLESSEIDEVKGE